MPSNETGTVHAIVTAIRREWPDAWVMKVHGSPYQMTGVPDLLVCVHGHLVGLEVKHRRPGESREHAASRVTLGQRKQIRDLHRAGAGAGCVVSPTEAVEMIQRSLDRVLHTGPKCVTLV